MRQLNRGARRAGVVSALTVLLIVAGGCAEGEEDEEPASAKACGHIDGDLVTELSGGRDWTDDGSLYYDGRVRDGCAVLDSQQFLLVSPVDFRDEAHAAATRPQVLEERRRKLRTCPQSIPAPVTEDNVTTACRTEEKIDYTEWNPRRLVRVTLFRLPGTSVSIDGAAQLSELINQRIDESEDKGEG